MINHQSQNQDPGGVRKCGGGKFMGFGTKKSQLVRKKNPTKHKKLIFAFSIQTLVFYIQTHIIWGKQNSISNDILDLESQKCVFRLILV